MRALSAFLFLLVLASCGSTDSPDRPSEDERLIFEGAEEIPPAKLREFIQLDLKRYRADPRFPVLQDAAFRIEYRYRLDGFARVRVTPRVVADTLIFHVDEGPRIRLGQVQFEGATLFKPEELKALVPGRFLGESPPFSLRLVILIEDGIAAAYRDRGYLDIAVTREVASEPDKNGRIHVRFSIDEGPQFTIVEIRGVPPEAALEEKTRIFLARPYTPGTSEDLEATVVDYYHEHGHPYSTARVRASIDRDTGSVALDVEVRTGSGVRTGKLNITGTTWTRASFIQDRSGIETGQEYRGSDLRRAEERLMATNIFKRVRVSPAPFEEESGTVPLEIEVEEQESGVASVSGGYGSFEHLRVGVDLTGVNIWGGAESIRVGGSISSVGYRGESELGLPYLWGTDFRLGITGYYESRQYPSFDALSRGGVVSLSYPLLKTLNATVGVRHANIITSNVSPSVLPGDLLDFDYTALLFSPTLDLRDNPLMPTRGILLTSEVSWAPSSLLSEVEFWSASGRFSFFIPLPEGLVVAASFQGGVIAPIGGTTEIPISLRYFAGGTNTVRGFKFESIGPQAGGEPTGGEAFLAAQSEVRFPIWGDVQGAVFSDQGGVWFDRLRVNLTEIRYSVGLGLRYATPAGALVSDVGWNPHTKQGEHPVEFHLSVGFPF